MKIFHNENERTVVYVQMQDIMYISNETYIPIPTSIFTKVFSGVTIVDDLNRFNFVRFDEDSVVKFFKDLDFIIDYDEYKSLTDEQIEQRFKNFINEHNNYVKKWNEMSEMDREKNTDLFFSANNIEYVLNFIRKIYALKHNKTHMPFPDFVNN